MKLTCPKCQQPFSNGAKQCVRCGCDLSVPLVPDDSQTEALLDESDSDSTIELPSTTLGNPLLSQPFETVTTLDDVDSNQSFGTLEILPANNATAESTSNEAVGPAAGGIEAGEIGTVDFDQPFNMGLTADLQELMGASVDGDEDATVDLEESSSPSDLSSDNEELPESGPHGTVVDMPLGQTISMDEVDDSDGVGPDSVGPGGTVVEEAADRTVEFALEAGSSRQSDSSSNDLGRTVPELSESSDPTIQSSVQSIDKPADTNSQPQSTVDLADGSLDFATSTVPPDASGTASGDQSATIDLKGSLDFDTDAFLPKPSDATVRLDPSEATLDVSMLGPANRGTERSQDLSINTPRRESSQVAGETPSSATGTTGRVQRMWQGAGASQYSPGNTLKAAAQLASDDIFSLVQPRAMIAQDIEALVNRGGKNERDRELIQHCLKVACQHHFDDQADYEVNGFLGKGAMGVVLQARQLSIGRDVAIKMIQPPSSNAATVANTRDLHRKFLYEAQVTGKLDHPNIVPVYELGISNGALFYSMKKISGVEWTKRIKQSSRDENLDVLMKVADAMAFSHQRNIIHRDLKPDNIMLGAFGEVLVTDWGCAVDLNVHRKFSGAGSPPWMAPEMALQQHDILGPKSDMYLLGAILYQIVTGHPPHPGKTAMEALMAAARNQIIAVSNPDHLLEIAYRAMKTDPADRYENIEAMQEAIRQYRRHAESIAISQRCEAILESAIESKDYEKFSRAIFGFQDALELWPENSAASAGIERARYAYGQCAFSRKDFDLCLETLDRSVEQEATLYQQALDAKQAVALRERRFQTLRKSLAAAVLTGLAVTAVLATIAWVQRNSAVKAKEEAIIAQGAAEDSAKSERLARENEEKAKLNAVSAQRTAEIAAENEREAKLQEQEARVLAQAAQKLAEESARAERIALQESLQRSAQVELGSMRSNLALALNQVQRVEMARAGESLRSVASPESYRSLASLGLVPKVQNWAWNRVNLLTNRDLKQVPWGDRITAWHYSSEANRGVMAVQSGQQFWLKLFAIQSGKVEIDPNQAIQIPVAATSLTIMNSGDAIAVTTEGTGQGQGTGPESTASTSTAYLWKLDSNTIQALSSVRNESLQGLASLGKSGIVGGLNQGLWIWRNALSDAEPERIKSVQGRLKSIQTVDESQVLVLAEMANQAVIHWVGLDAKQASEYLRFIGGGKVLKPTAVCFAAGKLLIGTESGQVYSLDYSPTSRGEVTIPLSQLRELPGRHSSALRSIVAHPDGTLLTIAQEPSVRVWQASDHESGWSLQASLNGPTCNVQSVHFGGDSNQVVAIAEDASSIVWDVRSQLLRERIQYPSASGSSIAENSSNRDGGLEDSKPGDELQNRRVYDAPVVAVVTSRSGTEAVSILENGRIDRWNPRTGQAISTSGFSYAGHDPTAELVDLDVDQAAGIVVTSARLPIVRSLSSNSLREVVSASKSNDDSGSNVELQRDWEFVKWDARTGQMLDRWRSRSAEEIPVSLSNGSKYVLYGSDRQTLIQTTDHRQQQIFQSDDFGSSLSSANPKNANELMLVKLNGVARVIKLDQLESSWKQVGLQLSEQDYHRIATKGDRIVAACWAPSGDCFYMVWESGRITELVWEADHLSLSRDLVAPEERLDLSLGKADATVRINSRWSVDAKVRSSPDRNTLYVLVRFPGPGGVAGVNTIEFPRSGEATQRTRTISKHPQAPAVLTDDDVPQVSEAATAVVQRIDASQAKRLIGLRTFGDSTYCALKQGDVYQVSEGRLQVLGRPPVLSGCGDDTANTIVTLHQGGVLWRADWNGAWSWKQLAMAPADAKRVQISADGKQLMIERSQQGGAILLSAETGERLQTPAVLETAVAATWDRNSAELEIHDLAIVCIDASGVLRVADSKGVREVALVSGKSKVEHLSLFHEAWSEGNPPTRWIITTSGDELVFSELEGKRQVKLPLPTGTTAIEPSPVDGLLAIGGSGTVAIYFCAPSLDEPGRELFSLPGHAGSTIRTLHFSQDGSTLITSDASYRQQSWITLP